MYRKKYMNKYWLQIAMAILFSCLVVIASVGEANAQGTVYWDDPVQLSDSKNGAGSPAIAVDLSGTVHVIWSQSTQDGVIGEGDTLFYTQFDGQTWSPPIDVLVSTTGLGAAQFPEMVATSDGVLHVTWTSGGETANLMYSRVHVCCGEDVYQWSKPISLATPVNQQTHFATDARGNLYIAYADTAMGEIFFLYSLDGGNSWSDPVKIPSVLKQPDEYSLYPRLSVGQSGRIHLVWNVLPWPGRSIWYSYSDDHGQTWHAPVKIDDINSGKYREDFGPIVPNVQTRGENEVHIVWDGAPTVERNHVFSMDGGETWSQPDIVFPEISLSGRAGWNEMAVDSAGTLHVVSILGPLHSSWDGQGWIASQDIATRNYLGDGEMMRLVIGLGNQLSVVWLDRNSEPFSVWYVHGVSSAEPIAPLIFPTRPANNSPAGTTAITNTVPGSQPTKVNVDSEMREVISLEKFNPASPVIAGLLSAIVLIAILVILTRVKRVH